MKTSLKSSLEQALEKWADEACENEARPDGNWDPELITHMTEAAAVVFDASFSSAISAAEAVEQGA
jgi:hypothetical protein